jgi:hypothetical protein
MERIIFYLFVVSILPTLISLFNIGSIVYIIGEFKENVFEIPKVIYLFFLKILFLFCLQMHAFHFIFNNFLPEDFYYVSIVINLYVLLEYYLTNKYIFTYLKYTNIHNNIEIDYNLFNKYLLTINKKILNKNIFVYILTEIFEMVVSIWLILFLVLSEEFCDIFVLLLIIINIIIFGIKQYLNKYFNTL